jgi:hypothetical protein
MLAITLPPTSTRILQHPCLHFALNSYAKRPQLAMERDFYVILGLEPGASAEEGKRFAH